MNYSKIFGKSTYNLPKGNLERVPAYLIQEEPFTLLGMELPYCLLWVIELGKNLKMTLGVFKRK